MGKKLKKGMEGIKNLVSFQAINFGRTSVVLFQLLLLVLGDLGCEIRKGKNL